MQSLLFEKKETCEIYEQNFSQICKKFFEAKRIVCITGAGISVSAGIPDFRSAGGLYDKIKLKYGGKNLGVLKGKDFFDASIFNQPETRPLFYQFVAELKESCETALPTPTHHFLKGLIEEGKLLRWYTQNIDCLEDLVLADSLVTEKAKNSPVIPLHGTLSKLACTLCKENVNFSNEYLEMFKKGEEPPCSGCSRLSEDRQSRGLRKLRSGFLRPDIVLYHEQHPNGDGIADQVIQDINKQPNILLVVGTSLKVAGLKRMIKDFAKTMKSRAGGENNLILYLNKTPASRAEWGNVFDFELVGECDAWVTHLQQSWKDQKQQVRPKRSISSFLPSSPLGRASLSPSPKPNKRIEEFFPVVKATPTRFPLAKANKKEPVIESVPIIERRRSKTAAAKKLNISLPPVADENVFSDNNTVIKA